MRLGGGGFVSALAASSLGRQHFLYLTPEPQGHGRFRPGAGTDTLLRRLPKVLAKSPFPRRSKSAALPDAEVRTERGCRGRRGTPTRAVTAGTALVGVPSSTKRRFLLMLRATYNVVALRHLRVRLDPRRGARARGGRADPSLPRRGRAGGLGPAASVTPGTSSGAPTWRGPARCRCSPHPPAAAPPGRCGARRSSPRSHRRPPVVAPVHRAFGRVVDGRVRRTRAQTQLSTARERRNSSASGFENASARSSPNTGALGCSRRESRSPPAGASLRT